MVPCPVQLGVVRSWPELLVGAKAVPAGTSLASTQGLPFTVRGSKKRQECNVLQNSQIRTTDTNMDLMNATV